MNKPTAMQNKKKTKTVVAFNTKNSTAPANAKKELDCSENVKHIPQTKNITNLNVDCMENIFKHLELNDLLNIADSSKAFYSAACLVYKKQFGNAYMLFDWYYYR